MTQDARGLPRFRPGLYLLHKPVGATSFDLVRDFMEEIRASGIANRKLPVCHGGALDPFAEGLLLLLAGPATRLMELFHPVPKVYEAQIEWGRETDNGDLLGKTVAEGGAGHLTPAMLDAALARFTGWQDQVPPLTSNKRIGGERAYEKAHRGEVFELPPSRVYLHEAAFLGHDLPRGSRVRLSVKGGYYVRSLARDLGRAVGCPAHLSKLLRTAIGPYMDPSVDMAAPRRQFFHGRNLLPWLPATDAPPGWQLPKGFPRTAHVRRFEGDKLVAILDPGGAEVIRLGSGI